MGRAILSVSFGPQAFQKVVLDHESLVVIGSAESAEFRLPPDRRLGDLAALLCWTGESGTVHQRVGTGSLLVNGQAVCDATISHGDWLRVGNTTFLLRRELHTPPPYDASPSPGSRPLHALATLKESPGQLYAVLDAARSPRILELLRESPEQTQSLLDGPRGDALAEVAPYLVQLTRGRLLDALITEGWGRNWGIYLSCPLPFKQVRRHLRRFLRVKEEDSPDYLFFRYYDPRVLRTFLPTCTPQEASSFFGPIQRFWIEGPTWELLDLGHAYFHQRPGLSSM